MDKINITKFAQTVEVKIRLSEKVGGKDIIQFFPFNRETESELFDDIVKAVENSMNRQYKSILKSIKKLK